MLWRLLTVALDALVDESVQQRAAVVAERRTAVRVHLELVPVRSLRAQRNDAGDWSTPDTTRGHRFELMKQQCRGYRRHFFTTTVVNIWNFLPKDVVSFSALCSFNKKASIR